MINSAQELRNITNRVIREKSKPLLNQIEQAANEGKFYIIVKEISDEETIYLRSIGCDVIPHVSYTGIKITWEDKS